MRFLYFMISLVPHSFFTRFSNLFAHNFDQLPIVRCVSGMRCRHLPIRYDWIVYRSDSYDVDQIPDQCGTVMPGHCWQSNIQCWRKCRIDVDKQTFSGSSMLTKCLPAWARYLAVTECLPRWYSRQSRLSDADPWQHAINCYSKFVSNCHAVKKG